MADDRAASIQTSKPCTINSPKSYTSKPFTLNLERLDDATRQRVLGVQDALLACQKWPHEYAGVADCSGLGFGAWSLGFEWFSALGLRFLSFWALASGVWMVGGAWSSPVLVLHALGAADVKGPSWHDICHKPTRQCMTSPALRRTVVCWPQHDQKSLVRHYSVESQRQQTEMGLIVGRRHEYMVPARCHVRDCGFFWPSTFQDLQIAWGIGGTILDSS